MTAAENTAENSNPTPDDAKPKVRGRPFEQGRSGNPGGRPKGLAKAVRDRLGAAAQGDLTGADILVGFWTSVMVNQAEDTALRLKASQYLADRGWGKPPTYTPVEDEDPLEMTGREADDVAASFDAKLDEVAARRAAHSLNGG
jgi:hypothetical protein